MDGGGSAIWHVQHVRDALWSCIWAPFFSPVPVRADRSCFSRVAVPAALAGGPSQWFRSSAPDAGDCEPHARLPPARPRRRTPAMVVLAGLPHGLRLAAPGVRREGLL